MLSEMTGFHPFYGQLLYCVHHVFVGGNRSHFLALVNSAARKVKLSLLLQNADLQTFLILVKSSFFFLMVINLLNIEIHCQIQVCISILNWCAPYPDAHTILCTCWVLLIITPACELHSRGSHWDDTVSVFHGMWISRYPVLIFLFKKFIYLFFLFLRQSQYTLADLQIYYVHQGGLKLRDPLASVWD